MAHQPLISHHIPRILHVLLPLLHSPLAAPHVYQIFLHIGTCVLQKQLHSLGETTSFAFFCMLSFALSLIYYVCEFKCALVYCPALLVGHVTLRLLKPECELDPAWCQEDLSIATQRTVQLVHTHTVANKEGKTGETTYFNWEQTLH